MISGVGGGELIYPQMTKAKNRERRRDLGGVGGGHLRKPTLQMYANDCMYALSEEQNNKKKGWGFGFFYFAFAPTWKEKGKKRKQQPLSAFLDMHDSSAWLQPAWTIQC